MISQSPNQCHRAKSCLRDFFSNERPQMLAILLLQLEETFHSSDFICVVHFCWPQQNLHTFMIAVIHSGETQCQNQNRHCWPQLGTSSTVAYCWWSNTKCCSWLWQPAVEVCICSLARGTTVLLLQWSMSPMPPEQQYREDSLGFQSQTWTL